MEDFKAKITYFGAVPGKSLSAAQMKELILESWTLVGEDWHRRLRPKHFTTAGAREYGYKPRKGEAGNADSKSFWRSYTGRKQKKYGHTRPLVWSGELEQLSRARRIEARAFSTRSKVRVIMPQAQKANFRNPHSQINMREELTTVSDAEVVEIAELHNQSMNERLNRHTGTQTTTIT